MIEIVYNKEQQAPVDSFADIVLPKNIRQIGMPMGNRRIYIEDYVMTYLTGLANPGSTFARGAILIGECVKGTQGEAIFVSGALPAQNLELDLEESSFDGETWSCIYQEVKTYFPDLEVVGWFLSRMGFSTAVNDMIVQLHMDNFAGADKILYIMDALEHEDAFYMTEGEGLRRQSGYYIYYARNEAMQNYMIETKSYDEPQELSEVERKDEAVIRNYRKIMDERVRTARVERLNRKLYGLCAALTIAILALGVAVFSNYRMLEKMEVVLAENGVLLTDHSAALAENENGYLEDETTKRENHETPTQRDTVSKQNSRTAMANIPQYYTVQTGDTLSSISFKMYNSVGYVAELMEANGLGETDAIHEGDRILIPTIQ